MKAQCEVNINQGWYSKRCIRPAKYQVTHQTLYQNGHTEEWARNECGVCSRIEREHRQKLDNGIYYNDADLDHTYPIIELLEK